MHNIFAKDGHYNESQKICYNLETITYMYSTYPEASADSFVISLNLVIILTREFTSKFEFLSSESGT